MSTKDCKLAELNIPTEIKDLTDQIIVEDTHPAAHGGFADIWVGYWEEGSLNSESVHSIAYAQPERLKVALKAIRFHSRQVDLEGSSDTATVSRFSRDKALKLFMKELVAWKDLSHPNILPLLGIGWKFGGVLPCMVCPWQENGSLTQFLTRNEERLGPEERLKLIHDVAAGLSYLHSKSLIHSDLTGSNILVNTSNQALLSDFGLSRIVSEFQNQNTTVTQSSSIMGACSIRWAAPEMVVPGSNGRVARPNKSSDVYSMGCVMLQILTSRIPYAHIQTDVAVIIAISRGAKHERPDLEWVEDGLWVVVERCWDPEPGARPRIGKVLEVVEGCWNRGSGVGVEEEEDVDDDVPMTPTSREDPRPNLHAHETFAGSSKTKGPETSSAMHRLKRWIKRRIQPSHPNSDSTPHHTHTPTQVEVQPRLLTWSDRAHMHADTYNDVWSQIGDPDHEGWMFKLKQSASVKGLSVLSVPVGRKYWSLRYCILQGPHLYVLSTNDRARSELKGYLNLTMYTLPSRDSRNSTSALDPPVADKHGRFRLTLRRTGIGASPSRSHSFALASVPIWLEWVDKLGDAVDARHGTAVSGVSITALGSSLSLASKR